jgi:hypothetical protein
VSVRFRQDSVDTVLNFVEDSLFSDSADQSPKTSLLLTVNAPKIRARLGHVSAASLSSLSEHAFASGDDRQFPSNESRPPPKASTPQDLPSQRRIDSTPRLPPHSRHRSMFTGAPPNSPVFIHPPPVPLQREGSATAGSAGSGISTQDEGAMVFGLEVTLFGSEVTMRRSVWTEDASNRTKFTAKLLHADAQFGVVDAGTQAKDVVAGRVPTAWWNHDFFHAHTEDVLLDKSAPFELGLLRFGLHDASVDVSITESKAREISCNIGEVASAIMDDAIGGLLSSALAWEESAMYLALTLSDALGSKETRKNSLGNALARLFEEFEMFSPYTLVPRSALMNPPSRVPMNLIQLRTGSWQRREKRVTSRSGSESAAHRKREGRRPVNRYTGPVMTSDRDIDGEDSDGDEDLGESHPGGVAQAMFRRPGMAVDVPVADARTEPRFVDAAARRLSEFSRPLELPGPARRVLFTALCRNLLSCLTWREWLQLHSDLCEAGGESIAGHQLPSEGVTTERTHSELGAVEALIPGLSESTTLWSAWLRKSLQSSAAPSVPDSQALSLSLTGKLNAATLLLLVPKVSERSQAASGAEEACHMQILGAGVTASLVDRMQLRKMTQDAAPPTLPRDLLLTQCEGFSLMLTPSVFVAMSCIEVRGPSFRLFVNAFKVVVSQ